MEIYYLVIVQNSDSQAIYKYNSYNEVLAAYHSELAYRSEQRTSTQCCILNSSLQTIMREAYTKETNTTPNPIPD